eukprot:TRINITY_DN1697_c0_g1_i2.p1 TRINITY_DN1697_c0_g1~~TRINITY_DN1697_c0_g1_i2.p1  ORF type:complete len:1161 (-),score=425.01 TRINITY_DN1697_c0_g1_i2:361-3843(-)
MASKPEKGETDKEKEWKSQQILVAKQLSELKKQAETQTTEINQLKYQLSTAKSENQNIRNQLQAEVRTEKAKAEGLQKGLNQSDSQLKQCKRQVEDLTKAVAESADIKKKLQALQSEYQAAVDTFTKEKTTLSNELRKLKEEHSALKGDKKQQHTVQAQEDTEYETLQRRLYAQETESRTAHLTLVKENNALMEAKRKVDVQLAQAQKKASDLEVSHRALSNRVGDLERELNVVFRTQSAPTRPNIKSPRPILPEPGSNLRWTKDEALMASGRNLKWNVPLPSPPEGRRRADTTGSLATSGKSAMTGAGDSEQAAEVQRLQKRIKSDATAIVEMRMKIDTLTSQLAARDAELQQERNKSVSLFSRIHLLELERDMPVIDVGRNRSPPLLERPNAHGPTAEDKEEARQLAEETVRTFSSPVQNVMRLLVGLMKDARTKAFRRELEEVMRLLLTANQYNPDFERLFQMAGVDTALQDWLMYEFSRDGPAPAWLPVSSAPLQHDDSQPEPFPAVPDLTIVEDWGFGTWHLKGEQQCTLYVRMLDILGLVDRFEIPRNNLVRFVRAVMKVYQDNPYHTFQHAIDVSQMCFKMMHATKAAEYLSELEVLTVMVAALCHDVDHPGLNNIFMINEKSPLAMVYNDKAVLENHHASLGSRILQEAENNIFSNMDAIDLKSVRRGMISCILATDMSKHFKLVTKLTNALNSNLFEQRTPESRQLLMNLILHMADISNVTRPWDVSKQWSDLVLEEFLQQGDAEKDRSFPVSPFMDRDNSDQAKMSLGFIDFMVSPLLASLKKVIPEIEPMWLNLRSNRDMWDDIQKRKLEALAAADPGCSTPKPSGSPRSPRRVTSVAPTLSHSLTVQSSSMIGVPRHVISSPSPEPPDASRQRVEPFKSPSEASTVTTTSGPHSDTHAHNLTHSEPHKPLERWDSDVAVAGEDDDTATLVAESPRSHGLPPVIGGSPRRKAESSPRKKPSPRGPPSAAFLSESPRLSSSSPRSPSPNPPQRLSKSASDLELISSLERRSIVRGDDEISTDTLVPQANAIRSMRDSAQHIRTALTGPSASPRGLAMEVASTGRRSSKDFEDAILAASSTDGSDMVLVEEMPLVPFGSISTTAYKSPRESAASPFTRITRSPIRMPSAPDMKKNRSSLPVISGAIQGGLI